MSANKPSVRKVVASTLVAVTTVLLAVSGALDYFNRRDVEWTRLRRVAKAQTKELAAALAVPVWNIDRPQIEEILDSQAEVMPIEAIRVQAAGQEHGRVRDEQRRFIRSTAPFPTEGLVREGSPITFNGERIGTVQVFTTPKLFEEQLRMWLMRTVIAIVIVQLLLIACVYQVLWRTVLRPLEGIERYAGAVSAGGTAAFASVEPGPTAELENLRVSIETMVRLLEQRYAELQEHMAGRLESEQRFRTIFDSVNDAIIIQADDGRILDVNPRMCEMFGYAREEALELDITALSSNVPPYTQEDGLQRIRETLDGKEQIFEWHTRHRSGRLFWAEVSIRVATIDGVDRVLVVVRDIDQRKELEKELRRRETMSAMGALVAGVAHEVRNPLFGMTALLDAYADALTQPALAEFSAGLREQVSRLTHLTRDLLSFGTPVAITLVPDSLSELVDEAIVGRKAAAAQAKVTLRSTVQPSLPRTPMDRARMRQVLDNLLDNALQHSPPRGTVTVAAAEVEHAGTTWIDCTVEDDGNGFLPGDLEKVFEPFFTRRDRGIGLGMPIVQRIVQEHSGRVTAGNRPQGGAIITVRLPVAG